LTLTGSLPKFAVLHNGTRLGFPAQLESASKGNGVCTIIEIANRFTRDHPMVQEVGYAKLRFSCTGLLRAPAGN